MPFSKLVSPCIGILRIISRIDTKNIVNHSLITITYYKNTYFEKVDTKCWQRNDLDLRDNTSKMNNIATSADVKIYIKQHLLNDDDKKLIDI